MESLSPAVLDLLLGFYTVSERILNSYSPPWLFFDSELYYCCCSGVLLFSPEIKIFSSLSYGEGVSKGFFSIENCYSCIDFFFFSAVPNIPEEAMFTIAYCLGWSFSTITELSIS